MELRKVTDLACQNKTVFVNLDLPATVLEDKQDQSHQPLALDTIRLLLDKGCRIVIGSHCGSPNGNFDKALSLESIGFRISRELERDVVFVEDYIDSPLDNLLKHLASNQIVLLENLGFHKGEFERTPEFIANIADGIDFYVNDSFASLDKSYASVTGFVGKIPDLAMAAGVNLLKEFEVLRKMRFNPIAPFTVCCGGDAVSDQLPLLISLQTNCNYLLIHGKMSLKFLSAVRGVAISRSALSQEENESINAAVQNAQSRRIHVILPKDYIVEINGEKKQIMADQLDNVSGQIIDLGDETIAEYNKHIQRSKTVFYTGGYSLLNLPVGLSSPSECRLAHLIAETSAETIVHDARMAGLINSLGLSSKVYHIGSGSHAMSKYLEGKTLPGLDVLAQ